MKTLARSRDRIEILRRLRTVRPDSTRRWGRMSAHQMICHLADGFRMLTGQKTVRDRTTIVSRTIVKWAALYLPVPWPPGIPTFPEIDQQTGGTCPADFDADVAELERLVELVAAPATRLAGLRHGLFGVMSDAAWRRWGYLHTDHHLRQFGA